MDAFSLGTTGKTERFMSSLMTGFLPPDDLTVSEWAEKNRRLSPEAAAEPGPWRNDRTPYLRDVMDSFSDPKVRHIVMVAASQVGKTEAELNIIGYIIDEDPGSILFIHPTVTDAKEFSKLRVAPMIRDSPSLKKKVADAKQRDSANTILQKSYPGGILTLCGSTEAHSLCSKPIRYILGDERDRWAASAGNEGDPWDLAMARQTTFYNAKAVEVSTPTIKNASAIEAAYAQGTMERWMTKCPHCGEYHEMQWENLRFEYTENEAAGKVTYRIGDIWHICPGCGGVSDERTMKRQHSKWVATNPEALANGCRSFWLNAFCSQWATWESIIQKFLGAQNNSKKLQVVFNTCFGQLWEDRGDLQGEDELIARREVYPAELPGGVLVLTCGIDTQDDRLEYEIVGHGHFGENWGIRVGVIMGRPDADATWDALDDVLDHLYSFENGVRLRISMSFMDEGGHFTQEVRAKCRERMGKRLFCIKGFDGNDKPYTAPPKKVKITLNGSYYGETWQYQLGVNAGKQMIFDNLRVQTPGPNFCHFPRRDDYGPAFFHGLLSEHLIYDEKKKNPWVWQKIPGHERNEKLDCRNYAMAAFKALSVDLDAVEERIRKAAGEIENGGPAEEEGKTPALVKAPPRGQAPRKKKGIEKHYDDW